MITGNENDVLSFAGAVGTVVDQRVRNGCRRKRTQGKQTNSELFHVGVLKGRWCPGPGCESISSKPRSSHRDATKPRAQARGELRSLRFSSE